MTKAPVTSVTLGTTGDSNHVTLDSAVRAMLDIQVPSTISAISYTIQSRANSSSEWVTEHQSGDETTDLTISGKSFAAEVSGKRQWRINVASRTGTGNVTLSIAEAVHATN